MFNTNYNSNSHLQLPVPLRKRFTEFRANVYLESRSDQNRFQFPEADTLVL